MMFDLSKKTVGKTDFADGEVTFSGQWHGGGSGPNPWVVTGLPFKPYYIAIWRKAQATPLSNTNLGMYGFASRYAGKSFGIGINASNRLVKTDIYTMTWTDDGFTFGPYPSEPFAEGTYYYAIWGEHTWEAS